MTTLDKTHFTEVERIGILLKNRRTSAAASAAASLAGVKGPDDLPLRPEVCVRVDEVWDLCFEGPGKKERETLRAVKAPRKGMIARK